MSIDGDADAVLSPEALERIYSSIEGAGRPSAALLELAASSYREQRRREALRTGRGAKADFRKLEASLFNAAESIESLDAPQAVMLGLAGVVAGHSEPTLHVMNRLKTDIAALLDAMRVSLAIDTKALNQRTPFQLTLTLLLISTAYRRATGKRVTSNTHRSGEYVGEPQSPFGRFAIAFFAEVDPTIAGRTLANAIRRDRQLLNEPLPTEENA